VVHGAIEILAQTPAMTFMARLGAARPRLGPLRLAIRRRRLGRYEALIRAFDQGLLIRATGDTIALSPPLIIADILGRVLASIA